jgi:hypothetical protein
MCTVLEQGKKGALTSTGKTAVGTSQNPGVVQNGVGKGWEKRGYGLTFAMKGLGWGDFEGVQQKDYFLFSPAAVRIV